MPKYDAFGREIGEDTLAGLGGDSASEAPARPSSEPAERWSEADVAEATAFEPEQPVATPPRPEPMQMPSFEIPAAPEPVRRVRRRGSIGCLGLLIVLGVIVAAPIVAVIGIVGSAGDTIDEIKDALESAPDVDIPELPGPDSPGEAARPPKGVSGRSMIANGNFGKALGRLDGMGRVAFIRLSPDRVHAQLVKGSRQRSAQVDFEGELARGLAAPAGGALATVPVSAIDRAAPARLVRRAAARYSLRPQGIDYLVLTPWPGEGHRWVAYFKSGVYVQGDRKGGVVRKISGP